MGIPETHVCHGQGCRVFWGMGNLPPLIGILIMGSYKPLVLGRVSHPLLYGNVMGVDRPDRTCKNIGLDVIALS